MTPKQRRIVTWLIVKGALPLLPLIALIEWAFMSDEGYFRTMKNMWDEAKECDKL